MPLTRAHGEADDPQGANLPSSAKRKAGNQSSANKGKQRARTEGDDIQAASSVANPVVEEERSEQRDALF